MKTYTHECKSNSSSSDGGSSHAARIYSPAKVWQALPIHWSVADGIEQFDPAIRVESVQAAGTVGFIAEAGATQGDSVDRFCVLDQLPDQS